MNDQQNAVVQVLVQAAAFNWAEPYRAPDGSSAYGSGFFIDELGHLVTNYHVVSQAISIEFYLPSFGKEQFQAKIVGVCPTRDVALLKATDESIERIKKTLGSVPFLNLGDSDTVVRTQEVITLGFPLGQDAIKSTQGIVSGRQHIMGESFIQITAALNPGSSGGPTVDKDNNVIGINTSIVPEAQNVGYIIPISDIKGVIEDLHNVMLLRTPRLGCELNYGSNEMLEYLGNPQPGGLYVSRVYKNTLLDKAGMQEGDMLYHIGGHELDMYGEAREPWSEGKVSLTALLNRFRIGQKIPLLVYRSGKKIETTVSFDLQEPLPIRMVFPELEKIEIEMLGGIIVMPLTMNHIMFFAELNPFLVDFNRREMQEEPRVLVTSILPNTQAYNGRTLFPGDVIEEINGKKVRTLEDFRAAIQLDSKFLRIKTHNRKLVVFSASKIIEEHEGLIRAQGAQEEKDRN
ncbi:trypsin-like peptidase domain-containing protein [Candidatus Babeliales bacterium]|nr:trypsin-like peptidase domain-containing protein [Candidatus Babeliales bacterium]